VARLIVPRVSLERLASSKPWLRGLVGGLPLDFDYRVVRSVIDVRAMMFELPGCDRAKAAVELYRHRSVVGVDAAYIGIMLAWTYDGGQLLEAFGSADQFTGALRNVAPPVQLASLKPVHLWRGTVVNRTNPIGDSIGLSWTRSRNVACWFALRKFVPALQPSLAPVVLHTHLDRSVILAQHDARGEQEVIIDATQLLLTDLIINLDGTDMSCCDLRTPVADLYTDERTFDHLIADWRLAAHRYEHWKSLPRTRPAEAVCIQD
jgi:hypothetical protein